MRVESEIREKAADLDSLDSRGIGVQRLEFGGYGRLAVWRQAHAILGVDGAMEGGLCDEISGRIPRDSR